MNVHVAMCECSYGGQKTASGSLMSSFYLFEMGSPHQLAGWESLRSLLSPPPMSSRGRRYYRCLYGCFRLYIWKASLARQEPLSMESRLVCSLAALSLKGIPGIYLPCFFFFLFFFFFLSFSPTSKLTMYMNWHYQS